MDARAGLGAPLAVATDSEQAVRIAIESEPAHLNPIADPDLWGYRIAHDLICEPLVRRKADAPP